MLAALNPVRPKSASAVSVQHNLFGRLDVDIGRIFLAQICVCITYRIHALSCKGQEGFTCVRKYISWIIEMNKMVYLTQILWSWLARWRPFPPLKLYDLTVPVSSPKKYWVQP